jgi:hypothetical protein
MLILLKPPAISLLRANLFNVLQEVKRRHIRRKPLMNTSLEKKLYLTKNMAPAVSTLA